MSALFDWFRRSSKAKRTLLFDITVGFDRERAYITGSNNRDYSADKMLVTAYILFLARYFFICDERQLQPVRDFVLERFSFEKNLGELAQPLHEIVTAGLSPREQEAELATFMGVPPLDDYVEARPPRRVIATYTFESTSPKLEAICSLPGRESAPWGF